MANFSLTSEYIDINSQLQPRNNWNVSNLLLSNKCLIWRLDFTSILYTFSCSPITQCTWSNSLFCICLGLCLYMCIFFYVCICFGHIVCVFAHTKIRQPPIYYSRSMTICLCLFVWEKEINVVAADVRGQLSLFSVVVLDLVHHFVFVFVYLSVTICFCVRN